MIGRLLCRIGLHHWDWTCDHYTHQTLPWVTEIHTYTCIRCSDTGHIQIPRRLRIP